ncbi:glycosyltransferase family 39 protein [Arenibacter sp. BSSL-BM3]|uniref:Glycosyltransferase family 39 protein n=1 Tax=Arenibacter arenosicollis TaxID=2762274 RepID=A0ABR7QPW9_9FLAO|nr:glycosyltransferase family 39 protein [Arenibacter arenosicollis]MBC8768975.1 glycosyltransferase family 39 protein [Arenibacter arenosicollis]
MTWLKNNPIALIFIAGISIFLFQLNVIPVTIMEARNFITAREMITEGNWLLTTMNELPRYEKPPLPSWITAIFGLIFGFDNIAGLRLPTMLMAIFLGYIGYIFSLRLLNNKRHALINALILLSSFYIIVITIEAPWDIYTHGFMLTGIYFLYHFFKLAENKWKNSLLAAIFIGLSFMSKGPVSLYALLLPFLLAYGFVYKYKDFSVYRKYIPLVAMVVVASIIGIWWFLYVRLADPDAFLAITKKETANWSSYNVRPFYYYWSFFIQSGIWTIPALISLMYPYLKDRVSDKKSYLFTFLWTIFSVILLSIIPEKKARYLVPVLIPLALNTGFYMEYVISNFQSSFVRKEKIPVYFHFGLIGLICIAFPFVAYFILKDGLGAFWGYYALSSVVLFTIGILLFVQLRKKQLFLCFLLTIALVGAIKSLALPLSGAMDKNSHYKSISHLNSTLLQEGIATYCFGEIAPEMIWDYGTTIPVLKGDEEITIPDGEKFAVLVIPVEENEFKRIFDPEYRLTLKTVYDLNYNADPGTKGHKNRLISNLYIVEKR